MRSGGATVYRHLVTGKGVSMIKALMRWTHALPMLIQDGAIALVFLLLSLDSLANRGPDDPKTNVVAYLIAIAGMSALTWRRRYPVATLLVATAAAVAMSSLGYGDAGVPLAAMFAFYSVAAHARRRNRGFAFVVLAVAMSILLLTNGTSDFHRSDLIANGFSFSVVWIIGESLRHRRERLADLVERAAQLERDREADARQAISSERLRIAQELHDVVAHAMSVIAVQSGMGAHVIDTQPAEAKKALQAIETTSRSALDELRRMLGVLRNEGDRGGALAPAPRADDIHRLVDTVRAAGVPVELRWDGLTPDVMPPDSVLLNRYRILQEALTNVLKHAGTASVVVSIVEHVGETTIEVVDDGRGLAAAAKRSASSGGHGLLGMRERVALFGGSLEVGPRPGGGYRVLATLRWADKAEPRTPSLTERR
jgi:signal transduction histidine kinase